MAKCFNEQPVANLKCIVLTILISLGYWYLPRDKGIKQWVAMVVVIGSILSIYAYDRVYKCPGVGNASCLKYIIVPTTLVTLYWYARPKNKWILLACLYFPYLALAWYDYLEGCKRNLGPTYLSLFYAWAKPKDSLQIHQYDNWCPNIKKKVHIVDGIIAVAALVVAPFFWKWKPK